MTGKGLTIALVLAAVLGVLFGVFPQLDITAARLFFRPEQGFFLSAAPWANLARNAGMAVVALLAAPAILAVALKLLFPARPMLVRGRSAAFLIATLILGPLLAANVGLKDHWGRPRPRDLAEFGGPSRFVPWWDPRGECEYNCSFVAGEPAGAFWALAPASLAPPPWRPLAYAGALAFGVGIGLLRMGFGGHFLSDVVFAGVFTFLLIWLVHAVLYVWPATRVRDEAIERALAALGFALRRGAAALFRPLFRLAARPARGGPRP